jgi:hypothetical protein
MEDLQLFIERAMELADKRNLAPINPIPIVLSAGNGEKVIVVVAHLEPNNTTLPFNVCWLVMDQNSPDYGHIVRRMSMLPSTNYRNTWMRLTAYEDIFAESQYWDVSGGLSFGEVEVPSVGAATQEVRGLVALNREYAPEPGSPIVVATTDPRMSDPRAPLPHTHIKQPITMAVGSTGINEYVVKLNLLNDARIGQVLCLQEEVEPGIWNAYWRNVQASDILYEGPVPASLEIVGPPEGQIDETIAFQFTANATMSDASVINNVAAHWEIIGGTQFGNIGRDSGIFTSLDIDQDEVVRVKAVWVHEPSGESAEAFMDVTVIDNTVQVNLVSIKIDGPVTVNENTTVYYTVTATYDNGVTTGITPDVFNSSNPGAGLFNSLAGSLKIPELSEDQNTTLTASFTFNGITKTDSFAVVAQDVTIYPESASIVGAAVVDENTTSNYALRVQFTDGSSQDITDLTWVSSNIAVATINSSGVLTAAINVNQDLTTTLSTSYTLNGRTVSATRLVTIHDTTIYPRSAVIQGSAAVNEGSTTQYQFAVTFTDDSTQVVTVTDWALDNPAMGSISATTGLFVAAGDIASDAVGVLSASYTASGVTVDATKQITVTDTTNYPIDAWITGDLTMSENTSQTLVFNVRYADGTEVPVTVTDWAVDDDTVATIGSTSGVMLAAVNLYENKPVRVTASYSEHGRTLTASLDITVQDTTNYPLSATVSGPNAINEGDSATYALNVTFNDGSTTSVAAEWAVTPQGTINTSGVVQAPANVDADTPITVSASYTKDGRTVSANKTVTLRDTTVYPVSAEILGVATVEEAATRQYQLEVTFTNATKAVVTVTDWASSDETVGTINANTGLFTAAAVATEGTTRISASYTDKGRTVSAFKDVVVQDTTVYPVSGQIIGSSTIEEGTTSSYTLQVTFSDNTVSNVPATWSNTNTQAGVINATTGLFTPPGNIAQDIATTIEASYTAEGRTVTATKGITVLDTTAYPVSAVINGAATIDENGTEQYSLRVTFDDDTSATVTADSWTSANDLAGAIDAAGLFTALGNDTDTNITTLLTATYEVDGVSVTATKTIGVVDTTNYPQSINITGPLSIASAGDSGANTYQYTATVTYRHGNTAVVNGVWGVAGQTELDNVGSIDANGLLTTNPDAGGATRAITVSVNYSEMGKDLGDTQNITFNVIPLPETLSISGPTELASESNGAYTATVVYDTGTSSGVDATSWEIDVDGSIASINSAGEVVTGRPVADTLATITATYDAYGRSVSATTQVTIKKPAVLTNITIAGDSTLASSGTTQYTVTAAFDDGSSLDVTQNASYTVDNAAAGAFDAITKGRFNAAAVTEDTTAILTFNYTYESVTKTATVNLTVNAPVATGSDLPRWGVAMFSDTDFTGGPAGGTDIDYDIPYEQWTGIQDFADKVMTNLMATATTEEFTIDLGQAQYGYFMHLKDLSTQATFTDTANGFPGGWNGATWTPEGVMGSEFTPIEVTYDCGDGLGPRQWLIYRTDWGSLGQLTYRVEY